QFDAVAERIADIDTIIAVEIITWTGGKSSRRELCLERRKVIDDERGMRLFCGVKIGLDAKVDSHRSQFEPATAACGEVSGLRNLRNAERALIEAPRCVFAAGRHRELHMIDCNDARHGPISVGTALRGGCQSSCGALFGGCALQAMKNAATPSSA